MSVCPRSQTWRWRARWRSEIGPPTICLWRPPWMRRLRQLIVFLAGEENSETKCSNTQSEERQVIYKKVKAHICFLVLSPFPPRVPSVCDDTSSELQRVAALDPHGGNSRNSFQRSGAISRWICDTVAAFINWLTRKGAICTHIKWQLNSCLQQSLSGFLKQLTVVFSEKVQNDKCFVFVKVRSQKKQNKQKNPNISISLSLCKTSWRKRQEFGRITVQQVHRQKCIDWNYLVLFWQNIFFILRLTRGWNNQQILTYLIAKAHFLFLVRSFWMQR